MISAAAALSLAVASAHAAPAFVNGLAVDGDLLDASGGSLINDGRMGFFSDIYYDAARGEWWALSDRGPGGGTLPYETRVHRFALDVDPGTGGISEFRILQPLIFLGGIFYSASLLPEPYQTLTHFNPVYYMISTVRYGFLGQQDVNITLSLIGLTIATGALFLANHRLFVSGYKLRT